MRCLGIVAYTIVLTVIGLLSSSGSALAVEPTTVPAFADPSPAPESGQTADGSETPALVIEADSFAGRQVVAVGRDVRIAGEALSDVAAFNGSVWVTGKVVGDVIVLNGDAHLGANAQVGGDVLVLGGSVDTVSGARIGGRMVSYPTASSAWITLLEGPTLGLDPFAPLVIGSKLALLAAWVALMLIFFSTSGREVLATSDAIRGDPFRCFFTGLVGVLAIVLTVLLFTALTPAVVSVPLAVLAGLLALVLKLWGMVAIFHALGTWLLARFPRWSRQPLNAATVGLLVLGVAKFLPWVGGWVWTAATLIGVGASLVSKFGRREAWFRLDDLDVAIASSR